MLNLLTKVPTPSEKFLNSFVHISRLIPTQVGSPAPHGYTNAWKIFRTITCTKRAHDKHHLTTYLETVVDHFSHRVFSQCPTGIFEENLEAENKDQRLSHRLDKNLLVCLSGWNMKIKRADSSLESIVLQSTGTEFARLVVKSGRLWLEVFHWVDRHSFKNFLHFFNLPENNQFQIAAAKLKAEKCNPVKN